MRFIIRTSIIVVVSHFSLLYFPWWSMAVCAFLAGTIMEGKNLNTFFSGFLALGLLWFTQSFVIHNHSAGILSHKVASLFNLPDGIYMVFAAAVVASIIGGFSTLSGFRFRKLFSRKKSRGFYR